MIVIVVDVVGYVEDIVCDIFDVSKEVNLGDKDVYLSVDSICVLLVELGVVID